MIVMYRYDFDTSVLCSSDDSGALNNRIQQQRTGEDVEKHCFIKQRNELNRAFFETAILIIRVSHVGVSNRLSSNRFFGSY